MIRSNVRMFVDGKEIANTVAEVELKIDTSKETSGSRWGKSYEGTLEIVKIDGELLNYFERQRKLLKMQKARERLYRDIDKQS